MRTLIDLRTPFGSAARPTFVGLAIDLRTPFGSAARPTFVGLAIALLALAACGGAQHPRSTGMKELAAEMDAESADLARIVHDLRTDCPRMASELRAVFARMTASFDRARAAQKDPALAKELTAHMRAYDEVTKQRGAQMDADLAENDACVRDPAVRDTMMAMPTL